MRVGVCVCINVLVQAVKRVKRVQPTKIVAAPPVANVAASCMTFLPCLTKKEDENGTHSHR